MDIYLYIAACLCVGEWFGSCMSVPCVDHQLKDAVHIGLLTDCTWMSHGCENQVEMVYSDNLTVAFNLHWINIATSEIYDVTQAIKRSRESIDFYLVLTTHPPISPTLSVLEGLRIPYMRMCVLLTPEYHQTVCLPRYRIHPNVQQNSLLPGEVTTDAVDVEVAECMDQTCDTQLISYIENEDDGMHCTGSDEHENEQHLSCVVTSLVSSAKWKSLLLLYESLFERNIGSLFDGFSMFGLVTRGSHMIDRTSEAELIDIFNQTIAMVKQNSVQIVVLCKERCLEILKAMKVYDLQQKAAKAFYYFAEVLLVTMATTETFHQELTNSTFNNIAVVTLPIWLLSKDERESNSTAEQISVIKYLHTAADMALQNLTELHSLPADVLDQMEKYQASKALLWFPVDTLVWDRDGRRLSRVGRIHITGEYRLSGSLFPNKEFGFNGRQLLVSTLAYYPFVENIGNRSYDGLCFDILRQLSKDMNFT